MTRLKLGGGGGKRFAIDDTIEKRLRSFCGYVGRQVGVETVSLSTGALVLLDAHHTPPLDMTQVDLVRALDKLLESRGF